MRSFGPVDHFAAGAVGEPGARAFHLEVEAEGVREWFLLEKQQVAALAERILELLRPLGTPPQDPGPGLGAPVPPTFRVGDIGLGTDVDGLVVVLEPAEEGDEPVGFTLAPEQADAAARAALEVVGAGRPTCRFCGRPKDPEGHTCPATNGDLRHDR
ncbi:MAG: DUF3090 family protein [Acidimicrobiia bacterium]|nr:DUF3090 family protein [Acidimicrobiia bacterium]